MHTVIACNLLDDKDSNKGHAEMRDTLNHFWLRAAENKNEKKIKETKRQAQKG